MEQQPSTYRFDSEYLNERELINCTEMHSYFFK